MKGGKERGKGEQSLKRDTIPDNLNLVGKSAGKEGTHSGKRGYRTREEKGKKTH